jgi:hypothetical protein
VDNFLSFLNSEGYDTFSLNLSTVFLHSGRIRSRIPAVERIWMRDGGYHMRKTGRKEIFMDDRGGRDSSGKDPS